MLLAVMPSPPGHDRRDSPPRQTLPPISDLLKGPPDERSREDKQDRNSYDGQSSTGRPASNLDPFHRTPPDGSRTMPVPTAASGPPPAPPIFSKSHMDVSHDRERRTALPPIGQAPFHSAQPSPTFPSNHPAYHQQPPPQHRPELQHASSSYGPPHHAFHQPPSSGPGPHPSTPTYPPYHSASGTPFHAGSPMDVAGSSSSVPDLGDDRPSRRRRGNLPKWATDYLKQWFFEHVAHPYPTEQEKQELCKITGLGMTQLSNWFINARRRQTPALHAQAQAENMLRQNSDSHHSGDSPDESGGPSPRGQFHQNHQADGSSGSPTPQRHSAPYGSDEQPSLPPLQESTHGPSPPGGCR